MVSEKKSPKTTKKHVGRVMDAVSVASAITGHNRCGWLVVGGVRPPIRFCRSNVLTVEVRSIANCHGAFATVRLYYRGPRIYRQPADPSLAGPRPQCSSADTPWIRRGTFDTPSITVTV